MLRVVVAIVIVSRFGLSVTRTPQCSCVGILHYRHNVSRVFD
jgi:hypothetical protein